MANITRIIVTAGTVDIGTDATDSDQAQWRETASAALAKAFPRAEIEIGYTDSRNSPIRLVSDDEDADLEADTQYAVQVLERMW